LGKSRLDIGNLPAEAKPEEDLLDELKESIDEEE